jgi:alcohol dehydrogenase
VRLRVGNSAQILREVTGRRRALVITTPGMARRDAVRVLMATLSNAVLWDKVEQNPDPKSLLNNLPSATASGAELLIAIGGGSAIDTAKALAVLLVAGRSGFEEALAGRAIEREGAMPLIAVPTTAGTGSEVTSFATLWDKAGLRKQSISGPGLFAQHAILDAALCLSTPLPVTIASGLDAISQALEAIWNRYATPVTDALALRSLEVGLSTLPVLRSQLQNLELRRSMQESSALAGLAISTTRTAIAHSISYPITLQTGLPHGLACSFTLPAVLEFNAAVDDGRLQRLARHLGFSGIPELAENLRMLLRKLDVPRLLAEYGVGTGTARDVAGQLLTPGRADNNMRDVTQGDALEIVLRSLDPK